MSGAATYIMRLFVRAELASFETSLHNTLNQRFETSATLHLKFSNVQQRLESLDRRVGRLEEKE